MKGQNSVTCSLFAKWAIQNNSEALEAAHIKRKNENNSI